MTKLMRNDAGGEAEGIADQMQVITKLTNQGFFAAGAGQEPSISRQRIQGTKEGQALNEFTGNEIHGDHTFRFLASRGAHESPIAVAPWSEGNRRINRRIRQYACRCGASTEKHCHPNHYGGGTPA